MSSGDTARLPSPIDATGVSGCIVMPSRCAICHT